MTGLELLMTMAREGGREGGREEEEVEDFSDL